MKTKSILTALGLALITLNSGHSFGAVVEPPYNDTQLVVALFKCILFVLALNYIVAGSMESLEALKI